MIRRLALAALLLSATSPALCAADRDFSYYLPYLPDWVNAAVVVDAEAFYNSALAQKENWAEKRPFPLIPPNMVRGIMGGKFDPTSRDGDNPEMAVGTFVNPINIGQLAQHENGAEDVIAGKPAVLSSRSLFGPVRQKTAGNVSSGQSSGSRQVDSIYERHHPAAALAIPAEKFGQIPRSVPDRHGPRPRRYRAPGCRSQGRVSAVKCVADCKADVNVRWLKSCKGSLVFD